MLNGIILLANRRYAFIIVLGDVFWVVMAMAVTIMFGLAFGTLLTMLLVPVFYATFYRLCAPVENQSANN